MSIESKLLTAEEYGALPPGALPTELVRGEIVEMDPPNYQHGYLCSRVARLLGDYAEQHRLGESTSNDSGVVTHRNPDTVRGADVAFYSTSRVPSDDESRGYPGPPDLVFEIRSPSDRTAEALIKIGEYLAAGVVTVVWIDPEERTATVYHSERDVKVYRSEEILKLPEPLAGLQHPVRHWLGRFA